MSPAQSPESSFKAKWSWPPRDYNPALAIQNYLTQGGSLTPKGRQGVIGDCEDAICRRFDQKRAILLNSGTSALYAAFFAIGLEPGDEIICPTVTFHATASPALHLGAKVVLVDVLPDTACIDPAAAEAAISPRTKAIVTNAQWGHPVEQDAIRRLADRHGLAWIEDISHAHGASWKDKQVGTYGDLACASLGAAKIITGGLGGVIMGASDELMDRATLFTHYLFRSKEDIRSKGYEGLQRTGYGLKQGIHVLSAVLILDQITHYFDSWLSERQDSLQRLSDALRSIHPAIHVPAIRPEVTSMGAWYGYKPWIDFSILPVDRPSLVKQLQANGAQAKIPGSPPLHTLPLFTSDQYPISKAWKKAPPSAAYPNAERYDAGTLSIPTFTGERDEEMLQQTIDSFATVFRQFS